MTVILVVEKATDSLQVTDKLYHMLYSKDSLDNTLGLLSIKFKYTTVFGLYGKILFYQSELAFYSS